MTLFIDVDGMSNLFACLTSDKGGLGFKDKGW